MSQPDALPPVPLPRRFVDELLPEIRDVAELKVMLAIYRLLSEPPGSDGMVSEETLCGDAALLRGLRAAGASRPPTEEIHRGIELAVARGGLLRFRVIRPEAEEVWLMPATPENRRRLAQIQQGRAPLPAALSAPGDAPRIEPERPGIFRLYEQNVGLVTPIIADQLIEAMEVYPDDWIEDAIQEAVSYNRRQWRYIQRILERWATEGRGHETDRGRGRAAGSFDPERHLRGKHAPIFRRRG